MARFDLDEDQREVLIRTLRDIIAVDKFPLSPRIRRLREILAKLEPTPAAVEPFPAPNPPGEPTHMRRRRR